MEDEMVEETAMIRLKDAIENAIDWARDAGISFERIQEEWDYLFECAEDDDG